MPNKTKQDPQDEVEVMESEVSPNSPQAVTAPVNDIPAELLEALQGYEGIAGVDSWITRDKQKIDMRRIELVQQGARNHPIMFGGKPTTGRIALVRGKAGEGDIEYVDAMRLILIEPLVFDQYKMPPHLQADPRVQEVVRRDRGIGERMMWKHSANGLRDVTEGDKPVCTSNNGLNPWSQNVGQDIIDGRYAAPAGQPVTHRIGFLYDPQFGFAPQDNACLSCPFAQWVNEKESSDGKRHKPMCQPTFRYVVWDIDREEMFTIKGSNGTVHNALLGAGTGTFGSKYDGSAMPGIVKPFSVAGMLNKYSGERLDVPAFIKRKNAVPGDQIGDWSQEWAAFYHNRPDGIPTLERPDVPVYPVMLTTTLAVKNGYGTQPIIPNFTILDGATPAVDGPFHTPENPNWIKATPHPLSAHELSAYLRALGEYQADNWRDVLMGFTVRADDASQLLSPPGGQAQGSLPAPSSSGSVLHQQQAAQPQLPPPDMDINDPFA